MGGPGSQVGPAVVAKRLCDLLFQFPAAASVGVQWKTLARKYEERYGGRLDIASLGHTSAVTAATALLWDVIRLVNTDNVDNPIVAVEDTLALTARPGAMASWPSLYGALCEIVQNNGADEDTAGDEADGSSRARNLLMSKVKPLLQSQWHPSFEETSLGYLNEEGVFVKVKKMKHFVKAVIDWRKERVESRRAMGDKSNDVDEALKCELELVASNKHNDLVLRVFTSTPQNQSEGQATETVCSCLSWSCESCNPAPCVLQQKGCAFANDVACCESVLTAEEHVIQASSFLERELALLRAENASLKSKNELLLRTQHDEHAGDQSRQVRAVAPAAQPVQPQHVFAYFQATAVPPRMVEVFDDPFEPPPQKQCWGACTPSTCMGSRSDIDILSVAASACSTPSSVCDSRWPFPGDHLEPHARGDKVCALVPMWFSLAPCGFLGDRRVIPTGIVEQCTTAIEAVVGSGDFMPPVPPPLYVYMK